MQDQLLPKDELSHVDYGLKILLSIKWICLFLFILFVAFFTSFPISDNFESFLRTQLSRNKKCPLSFNQLNYHLFPPGLTMSDIVVPARCSNGSLKALTVHNANVSMGGLSFSPLGIVVNIQADIFPVPLSAKIVQGFSTTTIKLEDQKINLNDVVMLLRDHYRVAGDININALVNIQNNDVHKLDARIESDNLSLPSQNIKGFETPNLKINTVDAALSIPEGGKKLNIENLIIGDTESDLRVRGKGDLKLNKNRFDQSQMNISLEVAPSQSLKDQFFILENLLGQYNIKDGFYRIKLNGTINSPKPRSF